jgi:hypothetical protein
LEKPEIRTEFKDEASRFDNMNTCSDVDEEDDDCVILSVFLLPNSHLLLAD